MKEHYNKENENEKEIKNNCEIKIDDIVIPFSYFYKFKNSGKHIIKYSFNHYITNTNYMFYECSSLKNINISNFNTKNVNNMGCMFWGCSSLTDLNLSHFITDNVTYMEGMFFKCSSLTNLNVSKFNTQNIADMKDMFFGCSSLTKIIISNKNRKKCTNLLKQFENKQEHY